MDRHFEVNGVHIDGATTATVTIEPTATATHGDGYVFKVRPKHGRKVYALPLALVAEIACWRAAKLEAQR
jgi:hypothetical protein